MRVISRKDNRRSLDRTNKSITGQIEFSLVGESRPREELCNFLNG